jgi:uncharacterized protein YciI
MTLSPRVTAAIQKYFAESEQGAVAELLARYDGSCPDGAERIQLTILRLSRRDIARVEMLLKVARVDYRDLLVMEQCPMRKYIVGLLRKGPNAQANDKTTLQHASIKRWKDAGAIVIGGRSVDDVAVDGIYIFTVDSLEAAQALTHTDPGIAAGILSFEFHQWVAAGGLQVGVPKDFLDV